MERTKSTATVHRFLGNFFLICVNVIYLSYVLIQSFAIARWLSDEFMVGGQEGYWLSVDYVLTHGQGWLSHSAHCPPTKKMRGRERTREREGQGGRACPRSTIPPGANNSILE